MTTTTTIPPSSHLHLLLEQHQPQLQASGIPKEKWLPLLQKLHGSIFDAGSSFVLTQNVEKQLQATTTTTISAHDPEAIWLIDHAWTFLMSQQPSKQLRANPQLFQRMANLVRLGGGDREEEGNEEDEQEAAAKSIDVQQVMDGIWRYANMYKLSGVPGYPADEAIWYVQDEFGSAIGHGPLDERGGSNDGDDDTHTPATHPNVAMIPFFYQPEGCMYSILWPLRDLGVEEEVTRDYLPHEKDAYLRKGKMLAFYSQVDLPEAGSLARVPLPQLPGDDAGPPPSLSLGEEEEERGKWDGAHWRGVLRERGGGGEGGEDGGRPLRVYTDLVAIHEMLTDPRFQVVGPPAGREEENLDNFDIYWATPHIKSFQAFIDTYPHCLIGQLPNLKNLVCKDLLISILTADPRGVALRHLPLSYNLETSLHDFIREFKRREDAIVNTHRDTDTDTDTQTNNIWILKPWNQGRSLGIVITRSLPQILRLMETGPKVICKYIHNPVTLHNNHKFDLRLYLLLRQGAPHPQAYLHQHVLCRMANVPFSLQELDNLEKHLTVFHYRTDMETKNILNYATFLQAFDAEYGEGAFAKVREKIEVMAADVLLAACAAPGDNANDEGGKKNGRLGHLSQGRALLGLDVMLSWEESEEGKGGEGGGGEKEKVMKPLLLEVTYCPDLRRVLREEPQFLNDVFRCLVLDEEIEERRVKQIL